jgi:hypothetical protein
MADTGWRPTFATSREPAHCTDLFGDNHGALGKDRRYERIIVPDEVKIVVERSSEHPVEYAIMLLVFRETKWHTVRTFDNAHDLEEHHEHRYCGTKKQDPVIRTNCTTNTAMADAIGALLKSWPAIVESWERAQ